MSETEYHYGTTSEPGVNLSDIVRRVAALEAMPHNQWKPDSPTIQPAVPVAPATDEEAVAITVVRKCVVFGQMVTSSEARRVLAALDRVTAERDGARSTVERFRSSIYELEDTIGKRGVRIRDLEAQLADVEKATHTYRKAADDLRAEIARLTATDAKPLGWVNVYPVRSTFHTTKDDALRCAGRQTIRSAVPVYERPPRATARVTDAEIGGVIEQAFSDFFGGVNLRESLRDAYVAALRPLLDREATP